MFGPLLPAAAAENADRGNNHLRWSDVYFATGAEVERPVVDAPKGAGAVIIALEDVGDAEADVWESTVSKIFFCRRREGGCRTDGNGLAVAWNVDNGTGIGGALEGNVIALTRWSSGSASGEERDKSGKSEGLHFAEKGRC